MALSVDGQMTWTLTLNLQTDPNAVRAARRMIYGIVTQEGLPDKRARELELATAEVLTNARTHAYADGVGPVTLDITSTPEAFSIAIHNAGAPISLPAIPASLPSHPPGIGLFLISSLVDEVDIKTNASGQGISVTICKRR